MHKHQWIVIGYGEREDINHNLKVTYDMLECATCGEEKNAGKHVGKIEN